MTDVLSPPRFVTRRARACGCQVEGASDKSPIDVIEALIPPFSRGIITVHIYATVVDIGDPRWRLWLVQDITSRCNATQIEIHLVG